MEIKVGTLVKAWDNDASDYVIGKYREYDNLCECHIVDTPKGAFMDRVVEIPADLAKQLEELK